MHSTKCELTPSQLITFDSNDGAGDIARMDAITARNVTNNTHSTLSSIGQIVNLQTYQNGNQSFAESKCSLNGNVLFNLCAHCTQTTNAISV